MGDSDSIKCVVCAEDATPRVVKDRAYNAMISLFWEAMKIDVKYSENVNFELCAPCFNQILNFYDYNDGCVIMEKRLQLLTKRILNKTIVGMAKAAEEELPLTEIHKKIKQKFGTEPITENPDEDNGASYQYEFSCKKLDTMEVQTTPQRLEGPRKTVISLTSEASESTKGSVTGTLKDIKTAKESLKKSTRGKKKAQAPSRTRGGRKRQRRDTSEEEKEDVYNSLGSKSESEDASYSDDSIKAQPVKKTLLRSVRSPPSTKSSSSVTSRENPKKVVSVEVEAENRENNSENEDKIDPSTSRSTCDICFDVFPSSKAYELHSGRHTIDPGTGFQCRVCRKAYAAKEDFIVHKKIHDEGDYPCPKCGVQCDAEPKLVQHIMFVHRDFWNKQPQILCPPGFT